MIPTFSLAADVVAVIRCLESDALAIVATMPGEAMRLVALAALLRERAVADLREAAR